MCKLIAPGFKLDNLKNILSLAEPVVFVDVANFKRHRHIIDHGPMRQQSEVLENHTDFSVTKLLQRMRTKRHDIRAFNDNFAERRL